MGCHLVDSNHDQEKCRLINNIAAGIWPKHRPQLSLERKAIPQQSGKATRQPTTRRMPVPVCSKLFLPQSQRSYYGERGNNSLPSIKYTNDYFRADVKSTHSVSLKENRTDDSHPGPNYSTNKSSNGAGPFTAAGGAAISWSSKAGNSSTISSTVLESEISSASDVSVAPTASTPKLS